MRKIAEAAGIALLSMSMAEAAQFTLGGTADGLSFGSILLLILVLIAGVTGILALSAGLFAERDRFAFVWKRLAKLVPLWAGMGLALSVFLGVIALLLGRILAADSAKRIADWTSAGISLLVLPVGLHMFFRAGMFDDTPRESFATLWPQYLYILGTLAVLFAVGRLLTRLALPGWAGLVTGATLATGALLLLLYLYERQHTRQAANI